MNRRQALQGLSLSLLSSKLLSASPLSGLSTKEQLVPVPASKANKIFIFGNASRDLEVFRAFCGTVAKLKPYGDVQVSIGELAGKSRYEMPPANSPWHEYASEGSCFAKFFPHPRIAPFIPAEWVAKNRELLFAKVKVLREMGLSAAFFGDETHFLPAEFFEQYPQLRGPRVDHPRRSNRQEFSWCVDREETREMIEWMTAEFKRHIPELRTVGSYNNDSGGGLCWAGALYSGPNGPSHCEHRSPGLRVKEYMEAIHRGAIKGGGDVDVRVSGYFVQNEDQLILQMVPPNTYVAGSDPSSIGIGSTLNETYPAKNLLDPIALLSTLQKLSNPSVKTISIGTTEWYDRAEETLPTVQKLIEILQDCLLEPYHGFISRFAKLQGLALLWGGKQNADCIVEAFSKWNEAFRLKDAVAPQFSNFYFYVSTRCINRPLLFKPDVLTPGEEEYFLPYVFNVSEAQARADYIDVHGGRATGPASWDGAGLQSAIAEALGAAQLVESVKGAPAQEWLQQVALSLRIWASAVRSMNNFYFGQLIRDRQVAAIATGSHLASKQFNWTGDADYADWNSIQRDELDNTEELIAMLEQGGLKSIAFAQDKLGEDTFVLGSEIIASLKEKARLMRREWLDVQQYLTSPLK
jgi:hypothetical protein